MNAGRTHLVSQLIDRLRHNHGQRSVAYLSSMAAALIASKYVNAALAPEPSSLWYRDMNTPVLPIVLGLTYAFARLHPEDAAAWHRRPTRHEMLQLANGIALGAAAMLTVYGIGASQGWITSSAWGWEQTSRAAVIQSVSLLTVQVAIAAWEEEMVFRGYGLDTLRRAIGPIQAIAVSVLLFSLYHGFEPRRAVAMVIGGLTLTLLRLESGGLWLPFGFHFIWNYIQFAIFGPVDDQASIRPITVQGPEQWIGTPGMPEPGLISMLVLASIAAMTGYRLWRKQQAMVSNR